MNSKNYNETLRYRCLNEFYPNPSEDVYLMMCGIEQCTPDKGVINRVRDGYHLHVILSGEGTIDVERVKKNLRAGQMFLIKPGERLMYYPSRENPWTYCWMAFNGAKAGEFILKAGFAQGVNSVDCHIDTGHFFKLCDKTLNVPELNYGLALKRWGFLLEFLGYAVESYEKDLSHGQRRDGQIIFQKEDYVRQSMSYMNNNYVNCSVASVARYLGIDRSYFSAVFRELQGITPSEYLLQIRMKESSHMLQNLQMPIQDIARYVGYDDALTFSKAFKRFFGISPKRYRELCVNERPEWETVIRKRKQQAAQE